MADYIGSDLDDTHAGTAGNDSIQGLGGNDILSGSDGDDTIQGGAGNDSIEGELGNDSITGDAGADILNGGSGDDEIYGGTEADTIDGGDGNDTIEAGDGNDSIVQSQGDDSILGDGGNDYILDRDGDNTVHGGAGNDNLASVRGSELYGGSGDDSISTYNYYGTAFDATLDGGDGNDRLYGGTFFSANTATFIGGAGNDSVQATGYADVIDGGSGDDTLYAYGGNDTITAGTGTDRVYGGAGEDDIAGGSGDDTLEGDGGNDIIDGGAGTDVAEFNGNRADFLVIDNGGGTVRVIHRTGGDGDDTLSNVEVLRFNDGDFQVATMTLGTATDGTAGADSLDGTAGDDLIAGLGGNDTINGAAGGDSLDGNAGSDTMTGGAGNDRLNGGSGDDDLSGDAGNDVLYGGTGDDALAGGDDADSLNGDDGNDTLIGGEGNDDLRGDLGDDSLEGNGGADYFLDRDGDNTVYGGAGNDNLASVRGSEFYGGSGDDSISTYNYYGTALDSTLYGGEGNDRLYGGTFFSSNTMTFMGEEGNDSIQATGYADVVDGGDDQDTVYAYGGADTVTGGAGNDLIYGGNEADEIYGGSGDDTLHGERGNDQIYGGGGADSIVAGSGDDTIDGGTPGGAGSIVSYNVASSSVTITTGALGEATVVAPSGTDVITGVSILRFTDQDVVIGSNPGDTYSGTSGNDLYDGTEGDDSALGLEGNDTLNGNGGLDSLYGGEGNDSLYGGFGDDSLEGGDNADRLEGEDGADTLIGDGGNDSIYGGQGNDSLEGGEGNDYLFDREGVNEVYGGSGNDNLASVRGAEFFGGSGDDSISTYNYYGTALDSTLYGGDGNDRLYGGTFFSSNTMTFLGENGNDSIQATSYADSIDGGADNDTIYAYGGADTIEGGTGNDSIEGGNDDDTINGGSGDDTIAGNGENDVIDGGAGTDVARFYGNRADFLVIDNGGGSLRVIHRTGGEGDDTLSNVEVLRFNDGDFQVATMTLGTATDGTAGADSLDGTAGDDLIAGLGGSDTINGAAGGDSLDGNAGSDTMTGGAGNDRLNGGSGDDDLSGDAGNDVLYGGTGDDAIDGGDDADTLRGDDGNDTLIGGGGSDDLRGDLGDDSLEGGDDADYFLDRDGDNTVYGGAGNDNLSSVRGSELYGGSGDDSISTYNYYGTAFDSTLYGGEGNDRLYGGTFFSSNTMTFMGDEGDDSIQATGYADAIYGGDDNDTIYAYGGNDTAYGDAGDDSLFGGQGEDEVYGGSGDDILRGDQGNDTLDGGLDNTGTDPTSDGDIAVFSGSRGQYSIIGDSAGLQVINLNGNGDGSDVILNIERLRFSDGDVVVSTGITGDSVTGGAGDDSLVGTIVNDTIEGYAGNDTIVALSGLDEIDAGSGDDEIDAGAGNDTVVAGDGDDTITGGSGDDTIDGGAGNNRAVFRGDMSEYTITGDTSAATVTGPDGTDVLTDIRVLEFDDQVFAFNAAPAVTADTFATNEDVFIDIPVADILSNDSDPDGDPIDVIQVLNPVNGTAQLISSGSGDFVRFTPTANFNGVATFEAVVSDGFADVNSTVTVNVAAVNDSPDAVNDTGTTAEDTAIIINLLGNDTDVEDGAPTINSVGGTPSGTVVNNGDGTVTFTPNPNFVGVASFSYTVIDSNGATDTASVTVTVTPLNDDPVANNDAATTVVDTPVDIDVTGNDTDADGDGLSVTAVGAASNGTVSINDNGTPGDTTDDVVTYTPNSGVTGTDSFTYTVSDGNGGTDTATVTVTVGTLGNIVTTFDTDLEGWSTLNDATGLAWVASGGNPDGHATATDATSGQIWYWVAPAAYLGDKASFAGGSLSYDLKQSATSAPIGANDLVISGNGQTIYLNLPHPGTDWTHYDVSLSTTSDWRTGSESGPVATQTQINDVLSDITSIHIRGEFRSGADNSQLDNVVLALPGLSGNTAPDAVIDQAATNEDTAVNINVLVNDTDPDGDTLTVTGVTQGANGSVAINADGTVQYTPNANFNGTDSFTYTINDGNGGVDTATVTVTVAPVDDLPQAVNDASATTALTPVVIDVLANDSDVEGPVSIDSIGVAANGTVVDNGDGTVTYTPNNGFVGVDTFTYTITDNTGNPDTATVSVNVQPGGVSASATAPLVFEGNTGTSPTTPVTFLINRNILPSATITVNYTIVGAGFDQIDAADVVGGFPITGTLVLGPGVSTESIVVEVIGDLTPEAHETMRLTIVSAEDDSGTPVPIVDAQHLVTVVNDDGQYTGGGTDDNPNTGNNGTGTPNDPNGPNGPSGGGNNGGGTGNTGGNTGTGNDGTGTNNPGGNAPVPQPPRPPAPPSAPPGKEGDVWGDPHLVTFDGARWDFQAVGEFIASIGTEAGDDWQIQMRFTPFGGSSTISSVGAVATVIDGHTIAVYRNDQIPNDGTQNLMIDGVGVTIDPYAGPISVGPNGGQVWWDGNNAFRIVYPSGEQMLARISGSYMNVCIWTTDEAHPDNTFRGLLGQGDGDSGNEIILPDGTVLEDPSFATIYGAYADAWRITDETSFFTYSDGEGTADHTDLNFPTGVVQISDFPQEAIDAATAVVDELNISNPFLRDAAILDVLVSGDPLVGRSSTQVAAEPTTQGEPTETPTLNATSIASLTPFASEGATGETTTFQFQIIRIGDTSDAEDVDWEVIAGSADADDFGGTFPSGTVSFTAGQSMAIINVEATGDVVPEFDETFRVQITTADGVYVAQSSQGIIVNDDGPLPSTFQIYASQYQTTEGTGTDSYVTFAITRGNSTLEEDTVTVEFSGTVDAADFDGGIFPAARTVTFLPGEDVKFVTLQIEGDSLVEGNETLTATLTSATGGTITKEVANAIIVDDDNGAPVADSDAYSVDEDTTLTVPAGTGVLANDTDPEADALTVSLVAGAANGSVTLNADGSFTYTPNANFNGTDSFSYMADDGNGGTDTATVTITVDPVNDDPEALNDSFGTDEGVALNGDVSVNDSDVDGDTLTYALDTDVTNGTLVFNGDGTFTYTPGSGHSGTDSFTYTADDGNGGTDTATVSITVDPVNGDPTAQNDSFDTDEDVALNGDVSVNDSDPDGDTLTYAVDTGVSNGALTFNSDGTFTYVPDSGFTGSDSFTYTADDGNGGTDTATVSITVDPVNGAPVAVDDVYSTTYQTAISGNSLNGVLANDSDPDGDALNVIGVQNAMNGTVSSFTADGGFNFSPDAGFVGTASFEYIVSDGTDTSIATVEIEVAPPAVEYVLNDLAAVEGEPMYFTLIRSDASLATDLLNARFVDITATGGTSAGPGIDYNASGFVPFAFGVGQTELLLPVATFADLLAEGTETFTIEVYNTVTDATLVSATGSILDDYVNQNPDAVDDTATTAADTAVTIDVLANDTDADSATVGLVSVGAAANGTVTIDDNGTAGDTSDDQVVYTPDGGFYGTDSFTYTVSDGDGGSDTATVTVEVAPPPQDELIEGTNGADSLEGLAGDDTIIGYKGNDALIGGADDDNLFGGSGGDLLDGGSGDDRLIGGNDSDTVIGGDGDDYIRTKGGDLLMFDADDGSDTVVAFDPARDQIMLLGAGPAPSFVYDAGTNRTTMTYGATIVVFMGVEVTAAALVPTGTPSAVQDKASTFATTPVSIDVMANDTDPEGDALEIVAVGAAGNGTAVVDTMGTADTTDDVIVYTANTGFSGTDSFSYTVSDGTNTATATVEVGVTAPVQGTGNDDRLIGTNNVDSINGGGGGDLIIGRAGDDTLAGQGGDDVVRGDLGDDSVHGGNGNDILYGSAGNDTVVGGNGMDDLFGGADNDKLYGGGDADKLYGGDGDDTIVGGAGSDTVRGGAGDDFIRVSDGDALIFGGSDGSDTVVDFVSGTDSVLLVGGGVYTLTTDLVQNRSIVEYGTTEVTFHDVILTMDDISILG